MYLFEKRILWSVYKNHNKQISKKLIDLVPFLHGMNISEAAFDSINYWRWI